MEAGDSHSGATGIHRRILATIQCPAMEPRRNHGPNVCSPTRDLEPVVDLGHLGGRPGRVWVHLAARHIRLAHLEHP